MFHCTVMFQDSSCFFLAIMDAENKMWLSEWQNRQLWWLLHLMLWQYGLVCLCQSVSSRGQKAVSAVLSHSLTYSVMFLIQLKEEQFNGFLLLTKTDIYRLREIAEKLASQWTVNMSLSRSLILIIAHLNEVLLFCECLTLAQLQLLTFGLSRCRCSWRVTVWLRWSRVVASRPMISGKCSRGTLRSACAAFQRSTAWARRRSSAPGWPSLTPSTVVTKIHARHSNAWPRARLPNSSSARTSCTRCSKTSSASKSLSTSCCTRPARWVPQANRAFPSEIP